MSSIYHINFSSGKLEPVKTEDKNNLPLGTILKMNGYSNPEYVITANLGPQEHFRGYGSKYVTVEPETLQIRSHDAYQLTWLSDKRDNRIATYITDKILPADEVKRLSDMAGDLLKLHNELEIRRKAELDEAKQSGLALYQQKKPDWAKAVIVAIPETDDSDSQTDYFAHKSGKPVILAWSKHERDLFPEMRKAAAKFGPTKDLATPSPEDEHREKYSMGGGYYLKAGSRHSTGWRVCKWGLYDSTISDIAMAISDNRFRA